MKYPVRRFKDLAVALKEIEPFVRNGEHLQTGKPFSNFRGMRSREVLANWLVCVTANAATDSGFTFCTDPIGGDGLICDVATGDVFPTEHVMVPRLRSGETTDAETLILNQIDLKREKGGAAYAPGKDPDRVSRCRDGPLAPGQGGEAAPRPAAVRNRVGRRPSGGRCRRVRLWGH
jgi:hypothetical protein